MADVDKNYGEISRKQILDNCAIKVVLSARDSDTQKYIAEIIGKKDYKKKNATYNGFIKQSENVSYEKDYIIQPSQLDALGNILIVIYPGGHVILHKKASYEVTCDFFRKMF